MTVVRSDIVLRSITPKAALCLQVEEIYVQRCATVLGYEACTVHLSAPLITKLSFLHENLGRGALQGVDKRQSDNLRTCPNYEKNSKCFGKRNLK